MTRQKYADDVMMLFNEGAEAKIYSVRLFGRKMILKKRLSKEYRAKKLDDGIRRGRTRREAKVLYRLGRSGMNVPTLFAVGAYSIYMEQLEGTLLRDSEVETETYALVGNALAEMHNANVSHGDFTPANVMLCGDSVYVIDFGLAEVTESLEEKAIDVLLMKRSISKEAYAEFKAAYDKKYRDSKRVMRRLGDMEIRGRYQVRTLA